MVEILSWSTEAEAAYRRERLVEDLRAVRAGGRPRAATRRPATREPSARRRTAAPRGWSLRGSGAWSAAR